VTRIFIDTEFIEDGHTIDLISIGMVDDGGREYYAVSADFDFRKLAANPWLMKNVWPSLPKIGGDHRLYALSGPAWPQWLWRPEHMRIRAEARLLRRLFDWDDPRVKIREQIAADVFAFIRGTDDPQLWAWYGAYDHVAYAQLFGRMIDLPEGLPMFTCDLKQECERLGNPRVPQQQTGRHDALEDARHNREIARFLDERAVIHDA